MVAHDGNKPTAAFAETWMPTLGDYADEKDCSDEPAEIWVGGLQHPVLV